MESAEITLSELTRKIESVFIHHFGNNYYWVIAEISGHKFYPNKQRHYFDLVEKLEGTHVETARIKAKVWTEGAERINEFEKTTGQTFTNGIQVLLKLKVEYHIVHSLSVTVTDISESFTLGNLEKHRQQTLLRLLAENPGVIDLVDSEYITRNKKLQLPAVIQHIAVISSPNSEGYNDFIHQLTKNKFGFTFNLDYYYSTLQGAGAESELVRALISVYESGKKYDAVAIIRGGGAKTDFLVFDTYSLSRAVARFPIPVITGIGHLNDVSIVDRMAHTQTKTPTEAAAFLISNNRNFEDKIEQIQRKLIIKAKQILNNKTNEIQYINSRIINLSRSSISLQQENITHLRASLINSFSALINEEKSNLQHLTSVLSTYPRLLINNQKMEIENLIKKLSIGSNNLIDRNKLKLQNYQSMIHILNPENLLKRGFAILRSKGKIITEPDKIKIGDPLTVLMNEIEITTEVLKKEKRK